MDIPTGETLVPGSVRGWINVVGRSQFLLSSIYLDYVCQLALKNLISKYGTVS